MFLIIYWSKTNRINVDGMRETRVSPERKSLAVFFGLLVFALSFQMIDPGIYIAGFLVSALLGIVVGLAIIYLRRPARHE